MKKLKVVLTGISPMLMHADKLVDPISPASIAHKEVSKKKVKTREDHEWLARSDWEHSIYLDADGKKIVVPSLNIRASLIEGGKMNRLGPSVKKGVHFFLSENFLVYDGPTNLDKLWKDGRFTDVRSVRVSSAKIMRYRPKFDEWMVEFSVMFDPEIISDHDLKMCFDKAGEYCGIGDFRPLFGRFNCEFK